VEQIVPDSGPKAGGEEVTIRGTGFKEGVVVRFGDKPAADAAGPVAVEVLNPGGQKVFLEDGFTYK